MAHPPHASVQVKVVPGSSANRIAGVLGQALKIRVAAPPVGGRANRAACALVAQALGVPAGAVQVVAGAGSAHKTLAIEGVDQAAVEALLERFQTIRRDRPGR
ncbi:MAG: hypothetical protein KatS3mg103_1227 [Phycisphaerales bacterium]|nr:MAG: hypothetical protein KatS3mg103_1227 [Phycisphaerales bacterium]